jgi:hypothetical protein
MTRWLHATAQMVFLAFGLLINASPGFSGEYYPARTVWNRFTGSQLNISTFAFRDINQNGVYDMADHPMAGVVFEVTGGGRIISRRTNNSGFGNFVMSALDRDKDVVNRGEYTFRAMIPSGWLLTTDNATQRSIFDVRGDADPGVLKGRSEAAEPEWGEAPRPEAVHP